MKRNILFGAMALVAGLLLAADSNPQDAVKDAAKSLGAKDNYVGKRPSNWANKVGTIEGKPKRAAPPSWPCPAATTEWTPC